MHHSFLDKYSELDSALHRSDPRVKLIGLLVFLGCVITINQGDYAPAFAYGALLAILTCISKIPLKHFLAKGILFLPLGLLFFLLITFGKTRAAELTDASVGGVYIDPSGITQGLSFLIRYLLSIWMVVLMFGSTPFDRLLKGLRQLGAPRVFISLLGLFYRYLYLLIDEIQRMWRARKARARGARAEMLSLRHLTLVGWLLVSVLWRTMQRSERIFLAMRAMGFQGEIHLFDSPRWQCRQTAQLLFFLAVLAGIKFLLS